MAMHNPRLRRLVERAQRAVDREFGGDVTAAARAWGIEYYALYQLLTGRRGAARGPSIDTLVALAQALGGSLDVLLGLTDEVPDDDDPPSSTPCPDP